MKHIILGLALLTGFGALAQCPDPTFDGQTFYNVTYLPELDKCITEPLVKPEYAIIGDSTVAPLLAPPAVVLQNDACPEGYQIIDNYTLEDLVDAYGEEAFFPNTFSTEAVVTSFGDTLVPSIQGTGLIQPATHYWSSNELFEVPVVNQYDQVTYTYTYMYSQSAHNMGWAGKISAHYQPGAGDNEVYVDLMGLANPYNLESVGAQYYCVTGQDYEIVWETNQAPVTPVTYVYINETNASQGDLNSDGLVGANDLLVILGNFGSIIQ
jgi:hypothetical protein